MTRGHRRAGAERAARSASARGSLRARFEGPHTRLGVDERLDNLDKDFVDLLLLEIPAMAASARASQSRGAPKAPSASPRALPRPAAASRDIRDGPTRRRRLQQRGHAPVPALLLRRRRIRREDRRHDARPSSEWWLRGEERAPRGCRSPARRGASSAVTQAPRSVEAALKRAVAPDARDPQKALKRGFTSESFHRALLFSTVWPGLLT